MNIQTFLFATVLIVDAMQLQMHLLSNISVFVVYSYQVFCHGMHHILVHVLSLIHI